MQTEHTQHLQSIETHFDAWDRYKRIVENNYMKHRELYTHLQELIDQLLSRPFSMLELGCGDAAVSAKVLTNTAITSYKAIDLSSQALALAEQNLANLTCTKTLIQGDFLANIKNETENFDIIFTGFALHHLQTPEKQIFLNQCKKILKPDGLIAVIDIFRQDNESRDTFIKRYSDNSQRLYHAISAAEKAASLKHMQEADFPESMPSFKTLITQSGFSKILKTVEYEFHGFISFL